MEAISHLWPHIRSFIRYVYFPPVFRQNPLPLANTQQSPRVRPALSNHRARYLILVASAAKEHESVSENGWVQYMNKPHCVLLTQFPLPFSCVSVVKQNGGVWTALSDSAALRFCGSDTAAFSRSGPRGARR